MIAVIRELKKRSPKAEVHFWCDRKFFDRAKALIRKADVDMPVSAIFSGKLRRYHGVGIWRQLLDIPTLLLNIGDVLLVLLGFLQSFVKLLLWRPDVVFTKGGFVCLPVGMAAKLLRIPVVIHDSDAHAGLTNRILARWAKAIATGAPLEYYEYPKERSRYIGIPVSSDFHPYTLEEKKKTREKLGLVDMQRPLVVVTGGGLGAKRINDTMVTIGKQLLEKASVVHIAGEWQYEELKARVPQNPNYQLLGFVDHDMARILGAADVVVTRAGATTMLELAALHMPAVIVPNARLSGGHQLKNAQVYVDANAAEMVTEEQMLQNPLQLLKVIQHILEDETLRKELGARIGAYARPQAAAEMAEIILEVGDKRVGQRDAV